MAFSPGHYRSESGGQGHGVNTIDGIHVKISEQCIPLQKVTLPSDYKTGNPSEVLFMEYDFNLETKVLEWSEQQRKEKEAREIAIQEQLKLAEKLKKAEENQAKTNEEEGCPRIPNGSIPEGNGTDATGSSATSAGPNDAFMNMSLDILTPTILASASKDNSQTNILPLRPIPNSTSFNLADFENEQDPFDNLELKTLDDMAELNKVLQGAQTAESKNEKNQTENSETYSMEQRNTTKTNSSNEQSTSTTTTSVDENLPTAEACNKSNDVSFQQSTPLNIKDVEYPDFDTLETPDTSLTNPSFTTASQYSNSNRAVESQGQVTIQPGSYPSVLYTSTKSPQTTQNTDRSGSPYSYSPLPPVANMYSSQQHSSAPNTSAQSSYNYSMSGAKETDSDSQHQHSVINGHTQYTQYGNNSWSPAAVSTTPWSAQGSDKLGTNKWEPPKNYATSNPWDPPTASTNPWAGASSAAQNTNPWGPPSLYANSSPSGTGMRSAKSNPDLTKLTERPVKVLPTSHTPPPSTMLSGTKTPPPRPSSSQDREQVMRSWNPYSVLPPTSSSESTAQQSGLVSSCKTESVPDPYNSMSHELKRFVDRITDMGFSRARVARTAQKFGQDDKKVVDHLCLVNKMTEQGLKADQADMALHLFDQQEEKAKDYIKLLGQFKELGFPDDKIHEALLRSDLDENKTLDALTSS